MKKIIILIAVLTTFSSCQTLLFTWQIGEVSLNDTKNFQSASASQCKITFEEESYCIYGNGIELKVFGNGQQITSEVISALPTTRIITIPNNASIQVVTKSVPLNNGDICKRLGNVMCKLYY